MEALKIYIKDKAPIVLFYNLAFIYAVFVIISNLLDFYSGVVNRNVVRTLMITPLAPLAALYFWFVFKNLIRALFDYKKQELITVNMKFRGGGYLACDHPENGAYFVVDFCNEKKRFWMYNKNQIYPEFAAQETYKVCYYKHSRCIKSIDRITFERKDIKKKRKEKAQKKSPQINNKKVFFSNHIDGLVVDVLFLLFTPFWIMLLKDVYQRCISIGVFTVFYLTLLLFVFLYLFFLRNTFRQTLSYINHKKEKTKVQNLTIVGLPRTKKFLIKEKTNEYIVKTVGCNGKKKTIRFYSTYTLGLGDLDERPGYKGFGNFIGTEYEVEYYKVSHVVKSMKIINQPHQ